MNLEPIRRAHDYFTEHGEEAVDMGDWLQFQILDDRVPEDSDGHHYEVSSDDLPDLLDESDEIHVCGTVCCIAGAMWLTRPVRSGDAAEHAYDNHAALRLIDEMRDQSESIPRVVANELGLRLDTAEMLFHRSAWPSEFRNRYATHSPREAVLAILDALLVGDLTLNDDGWHGSRSNCTCHKCLAEVPDDAS